MKRHFLILAALISMATLTAFQGQGSQAGGIQQRVDVRYEQVEVKEALSQLFNRLGVSYTIAPDVQGVVTADLKDVSFETGLQIILRQVDATYRIEGGVYEIVRRDTSQTGITVDLNRSQDDLSERLVTLQVRRMDVVGAVDLLFKQTGANYTLNSEVKGKVTVNLVKVPFETALQFITRNVDATYRVEKGVWEIVRRDIADPTIPEWSSIALELKHPKDATMRVDGKFLYVVNNGFLYKVEIDTMEIVAKTALK